MKTSLSFASLLLGSLLCVAPSVSRATHYALCVGINKYSLSGCSTLSGCVNDATYFRNNLVERGDWQTSDTTLLTNSGAKKSAIRNAITGYAAKAVAGDTFVYQHSSHGGQYSGTSVCLCAYDAEYKDTDLASDLAQFPAGVKVVVIVDACHSGGLFKSREAAKAAAASFDLAGRVSAAIDAIRADEAARGIKAAKLSANEIGWVTAAEYNESSLDGGYYDSDKWLTNGQDGNVMGGVFLGAFTWAWWNGSCDTKSGYGDNDGYADAYECWAVARACCTSSSLWGSDAFTPQYLNENVLRSVELGWVGDEEPAGVRFAPIPAQTATVGVPLSYTLVATNSTGTTGSIAYSVVSATAPANTYSLSGSTFTFTPAADGAFSFTFLATNATAVACSRATMSVTASLAAPEGLDNSGITATSFTAKWDAVPGAASYVLEVYAAEDEGDAVVAETLLSEDFAAFTGTEADRSGTLDDYLAGEGWTGEKVFENGGSAKLGSSKFKGWIATPELDLSSGGTVSFDLTQYGTSGDGNTVSVSIVSGGDETEIGTATPGATETVEFTIPAASAATSVKIATSAKRAIVDNLVIVGGASAVFSDDVGNVTSYTVSGLIPGDYEWRVRAVGNANGPYSETEEVTLVADPTAPPSIRPIADFAIDVGETVTTAVAVSTPEQAPVTSLAITEGDASATLEDGIFSFTPATPGTYDFTITAVNANGPAQEGFTVTVTLAEPETPTAPTTVSHNSFTASWTAVPGATAYELVVFEGTGSGDSGNSGDSGDSGNTQSTVVLTEDFATVTGNTSSPAVTSFDSVTQKPGWSGANVYPASGMLKLGASSKQGSLQTPALAVSGSVVVEWSAYSWSEDGTVVKVGVSEDGGTTFSESSVTLTENMAAYTNTFSVSGSSAIVRWQASKASKQRFYLDDITISCSAKARQYLSRAVGDIVFSNSVGAVTSYAVTGLQPETEYTFAIRAIAGNEATQWSAPVSVTTTAAPAAPAWSEIPAMTASVGFPFRFDLAPYVSGVPTPTLTLTSGSGTLTGSFLEFTPASAGSTTFTVSAANGVGNAATTTFTVTAADHEPVKYALCVGINEYADISGLEGCVNDSIVMASNLVERGGWLPANVTRLNDSAATKTAIRGAIAAVAAQAQAGDTFVYQHSSHGGQFNATEDDEDPLTGEDGKDTFLCVYDEDYYDNTTAYNDYEIAADLAAFPAGVKVVVIVDACHSGGLFKSKADAKASAASFDLAGRVTALMDADRARRRARGEDVARTLSSSEIGWATAAEYYEYSYDGGFYHTDEWLTNNVYGDEYWVGSDEDGYYNYPSSYKQGGVFLSSATWNWWNGDADSDAEAGDNDGLCDAYEFWKKGYDFCSVIGEFWYDDSGYNYFPQCANIDVLRSVELGWVVDPRPAAPADPAATGATSSSFTATWTAVPNAVSYLLHVQKKVEDNTRDADGATLLSESFEDGEIPDGWTASSGVGIASGKGGDGTYCVKFTASGASLVTPALENPDSVSFQYKRSNSTASWSLDVFVGPSATGPWTSLGTVSDAGTDWQTFSSPISASGTAYLKFADARSTGTAERYIDLVVVTGSTGTWEDLAGYAPKSVVGTSQEVTGLDASTDYRFSVRSVDANGLEGVESERTVVHTADADSAPIISVPQISYSATVGGDYVEFTVTATGSPAPTIDATCTEGAYYVFENGEFLFDPDTVGTYHFVFTASNSEGSDTATVTVTVEAAPVTVPTLTISDVSNSGALASWTACTDVASYTLQLATDDQFTEDSAGGTFELVNNPATSASAPTDWTYNIASAGSSSGLVLYSGHSVVSEAFDASSCTDLSLSLKIRTYNGTEGTSNTLLVEYSFDNGSTWATLGSITATGKTLASKTLDASTVVGNSSVRLRFTDPGASSSKGVGIAEIVLTGTGNPVAGSIILSESVTDAFYAIGNLNENTTYYARVKGDSDWSEVEEFTTSGGTGTADYAPIWVGLPTPSVLVGADCELNIGSYVYAQPDPVLEMTSASAEALFDDTDGSFLFIPSVADEYTFTFLASNSLGTATATLTVLATNAPVTVPTLLVTNVTDTTANASWTACDGVSTYTLQLSTNDFPAASGASRSASPILSEDFTGFSGNGTADIGTNGTLNDHTATTGWTGFQVYTASETAKIGASSGQGWIMTPALNASGTLTIAWSAYRYGTSDKNTLLLGVSENGTDFDEETITLTDVMASYTNTFTVTGPTVYVRWKGAAASKARFYLDDVRITNPGGGDTPTGDDIQEFTVSGTSYPFTGLSPETTYYARVKGDAGWSNVEEFTTESVGNSAPVLTVPETSYAITVGDPDVDFTVTATGTPAPTVTASCTEGAYFIFENNEFLFEPDTVGTYHFVFTATNSEGSDSKTVTVTVSAAPVTVPTLTVTNVTATTADASWTACDNVSTYTLQLASDDQFTTGGSGAAVLEADFSDTTGWTLSGTGQYTGASYCGAGSPSIKFDGNGDYAISPDFGSGVRLSFWAYGNGGSDSTFAISGLVNGSWTEIETVSIAQGGDTYEVNLPSGTSQVRFDFTKSVNCALDDVVVYGASGSGSLIDEYTVSGTSYGFTGLTPETTYYARVKGDDDWSNVEEFTTEPVGNSAPVWSSLPAQTVNVGEPLEFDLAPYVTGSPVPVILLGDTEFVAEMQGSTFVFDPSSSGDYTFSFTASNAVGTADATLSVTAVSEAPELTITPDTSFSVTVGDTVEFSVTATGIPAPAVSVSTMATVSYSFENGAFRFEANDPGLYEFEFSAENVVGTDTLTVTVEVLATVPTLTVSNVTATTAFASWNNCANVLEYTLQLSTNEYFETTGGAGNFTEEFSSPGFTASTRYSTDSQTVDGRTWSYENAMVKPGASGAGIGSAGFVQLKASNGILTLPVLDSPGAISIIARASAATDGTLMLQQKVNGSWEDLLNENWSLTDIPAEYTYAFTGAGASTELRLCAVGIRAIYIYDVSVTGAASTTDGTGTFLVLEGSGSSSYTFTDLLPDTTYYARVKGNDEWSNVVSFHTLAGPANLAEALGLPAGVTDEYIVCRITSFAVGADDSVSGTFAVTAEDEGTPIAESSSLSDAVQLVVLGAAELGDFAPLDATQCGVSLTSRTAPFAFRVERPGTNRFFQVRLAVGEAGE